jgi:CBS domain-containing protein
VDPDLRLTGVITGHELKEFLDSNHSSDRSAPKGQAAPPVITRDPVVAYPDEPLRAVVYRMAETGKTRMPVVDPSNSGKLLGMVSLNDLLHARVRALDEERKRERVIRIHLPGTA